MNPMELLDLAKKLAGQSGEAERRTAVGRAYYAALHAAARALRPVYGPFPATGAFHGAVADSLERDAGTRLHHRLVTLRKARRAADYDLDTVLPQSTPPHALHVATQLLLFVKQKYGV